MHKTEEEYKKLLEKIKNLEDKIDSKEDELNETLNIADFYFTIFEEEYLPIEKKIKEKEDIIKKIQEENKKLKEKIQKYEEIFEQKSIWHINSDNAWKIDTEEIKPDQYDIPLKIDIEKIYNLKLSDDLKWVSFKYKRDKLKDEDYKIPRLLAEQMNIIDKIEKRNNQDTIDKEKIRDYKDIIEFLKSKKINTDIENWKESIDCIVYYRGSTFKTKEFIKICKFNNRETARKVLNKMIEFGLIKRVGKGVYKVLFNF